MVQLSNIALCYVPSASIAIRDFYRGDVVHRALSRRMARLLFVGICGVLSTQRGRRAIERKKCFGPEMAAEPYAEIAEWLLAEYRDATERRPPREQ
jgi:hypothetical protein